MIYDIEPARRKHHVKAHRVTMERSKRYAVLGLTAGIACGFLLCLWTKPILPCLTSNCCLKQQLREEIRHEMDTEISQQQAQPRLAQHKQVTFPIAKILYCYKNDGTPKKVLQFSTQIGWHLDWDKFGINHQCNRNYCWYLCM